jgi:hypothetical protein
MTNGRAGSVTCYPKVDIESNAPLSLRFRSLTFFPVVVWWPLTDALVRNIYVDEAGTSDNEPYRVVVALIVHTDTLWFPALREMAGLFSSIPDKYRAHFSFHAKELFARNKYPDWDYEERKALMRSVMAIPHKFNIPIAVGAVKKKANDWTGWPEKNMKPFMVDHLMAFTMCMSSADYFLRTFCKNEMGQVTAEHVESMHRFLQRGLDLLRLRPLMLDHIVTHQEQKKIAGELRVERIIDEIHFTKKERAPFLQIADGCAFAFRRYFSGLSGGEEFVNVAVGDDHSPVDTEKPTHLFIYFNADADGKPVNPFPFEQSS